MSWRTSRRRWGWSGSSLSYRTAMSCHITTSMTKTSLSSMTLMRWEEWIFYKILLLSIECIFKTILLYGDHELTQQVSWFLWHLVKYDVREVWDATGQYLEQPTKLIAEHYSWIPNPVMADSPIYTGKEPTFKEMASRVRYPFYYKIYFATFTTYIYIPNLLNLYQIDFLNKWQKPNLPYFKSAVRYSIKL